MDFGQAKALADLQKCFCAGSAPDETEQGMRNQYAGIKTSYRLSSTLVAFLYFSALLINANIIRPLKRKHGHFLFKSGEFTWFSLCLSAYFSVCFRRKIVRRHTPSCCTCIRFSRHCFAVAIHSVLQGLFLETSVWV